MLRQDRWVAPYFRRYRWVLALALGLGVLASVLACLLMFISGWLIGAAAHMPESIFSLMVPIALVQVVGIGKPIVAYMERLASHDWALRMTSSLRRRLFLAMERLTDTRNSAAEGAASGAMGAGDALALLNEDVAHVQNLYLRVVFPIVIAWATALLAVLALGTADALYAAWMALELFVVAAVLPAVSLAAGAAARMRRKQATTAFYQSLTDAVLGAADVAFAGRGADVLARFDRQAGAVVAEDRRLARIDRVQGIVVRAMLAVAAVSLVAWSSRALATQGDAILAAVLCFFPLAEIVTPVADAAELLPEHAVAIERLNELDDGEAETGDSAGVAAGVSTDQVSRASAPASASPAVCFDHVTLTRPGAPQPTIENLTFQIGAGQKMALLGRSGAGKSTLLALIRGDLMPSSGSVLLAGCPHPGTDAVHGLAGVIGQNPHVFNTTVLDNLRIAKPDATEDQALEVLDRVGLLPRVQRFPRGLLSVVGEEGRQLSGGERHRLALARILLADTPLVLLDEPFAGLDPATERAVFDAMMEALAGRTVIMATHHLQGVERMDRVAFLENGGFVLDGSPAELGETSERYRRLLAADRGDLA